MRFYKEGKLHNLQSLFIVLCISIIGAVFISCTTTRVASTGPATPPTTKGVDLKVGDAAPAFQQKDDTGGIWKSSDHVGKKVVVVFFFPAAFTGG